jgi:hypothetical protein
MAKYKVSQSPGGQRDNVKDNTLSPRQRLAQARQAHAKGAMGMEDFIWTAMQCYAADNYPDHKRPNR